MKKILLVLIVILFVGIAYAQDNLVGIWGLTEMTVGGQSVKMHRSMHVDFNQDGKLYISGKEFGFWKQNANNIETEAKMQLDIINGDNKIIKLSDEALVLENGQNGIQTFKRASLPYGQEYKNEIVGEYLFVKEISENNKETNIGDAIFNFKDNGTVYYYGMFIGQWRYDKKTKRINISDMEENEGFHGENKIVKSGNELILQTEKGDKLFFKKLDLEEITKKNKVSGLEGVWKIDINFDEMVFEEAVGEVVEEVSEEAVEEVNEEVVEETQEISNEDYYESDEPINNIETNYLSLEATSSYSYGQGNGNSIGLWIYSKKEKTLYIVGKYITFSGTNKIVEINEKTFVFIDKFGNKYTAIKTNNKIE